MRECELVWSYIVGEENRYTISKVNIRTVHNILKPTRWHIHERKTKVRVIDEYHENTVIRVFATKEKE